MRIGFETITWGIQLSNLDDILDAIAAAGFDGVEIAQRFDSIGVASFAELQDKLHRRNLRLIGLVGGDLRERLDFCSTNDLDYLYVEPWELNRTSDIAEAAKRGFVTALHPRVFTPVSRSEDITPELARNKDVRLLLDTAHVYLAGEDPASTIEALGGHLVGVHLKDWTPIYGRSSYRYGRGFIELGQGILERELQSVIATLRRMDFSGWLVAEVDRPSGDPFDAVEVCAAWLRRQGLLPVRSTRAHISSRVTPSETFATSRFTPVEARFGYSLMTTATERSDEFYRLLPSLCGELLPCALVTVWACSPQQDRMILQGKLCREPDIEIPQQVLAPSRTVTGRSAYQHRAVREFDLATGESDQAVDIREFAIAEVIRRLGIRRVVTLPIYNSGNQNYPRLLVNMYLADPGPRLTAEEQRHLYQLGRLITAAADLVLDRRCVHAAARVALRAERADGLNGAQKAFVDAVKDELECEGVTLFLANETGDRLEPAESTPGLKWPGWDDQQWYRPGEGMTGRAWRRREPVITADATKESHGRRKSAEDVETPSQHACLLVPLVEDKGAALGVVRCRNKRGTTLHPAGRIFSGDDAATLDAMCQSMAGRLRVGLDERRRGRALADVVHELNWAISGLRNAVSLVEGPLGVERQFARVRSWTELTRLLVKNAAGPGLGNVDRPVDFERDVLEPVLDASSMLFEEYGGDVQEIERSGLETLPPLWVDSGELQRVVFNLLSNALKYGRDAEGQRRIVVEGRCEGETIRVEFRDYGMGVRPDLGERLFAFGVRAPEAVSRVRGAGVGLWLVRRIIHRWGGYVGFTKYSQPTVVTITLPKTLVRPPSMG